MAAGAVAVGVGALLTGMWAVPAPKEGQAHLFDRIAAASRKRFSPADLRADLAYLCDALDEMSVAPYAATSRETFATARAALAASFTAPLSTFEFALRAAPLFASLNDGHISISPDDMIWQDGRTGGKFFPVPIQFTPEGTFTRSSSRFGIPDGTRLAAIDDISALRLQQTCLACTSAPTLTARRIFASDPQAVATWLRALSGRRSTFAVAFEHQGLPRRVDVAGLPFDKLAETPADTSAPLALRLFSEQRVAYVEYRRCDPGQPLDDALQAAFSQIAKANVRALVIDIRKNGGGSDPANDAVLAYLTDRPYSQGNKFSVRASRMLTARYGALGYLSRYFAPGALFAREGDLVTIEIPKALTETKPKPNGLRFLGPKFVLIGPATFSSAMGFAETVQAFVIGKLVGEPLGEPLESNGQVVDVRAPRTCLNAAIPTKYFYATASHEKPHVEPDILVATTPADIRAGRDPVLREALRLAAAEPRR